MKFEEDTKFKKLGRNIGFLLALILFLSILYLIFSLLNKLPTYIDYTHVLIIAIILYVFRLLYETIKK